MLLLYVQYGGKFEIVYDNYVFTYKFLNLELYTFENPIIWRIHIVTCTIMLKVTKKHAYESHPHEYFCVTLFINVSRK